MHKNTAAIALTSLLLGAIASAAPLEGGPGPEERWFASSYLDDSCGGSAFQNFSGSGSSCNVIEDMHPPADFVIEIKSIQIGSDFGTYDFIFLPDTACAVTGVADIIHKVKSGKAKCVNISSEDSSFNVTNISHNLASKRAVALPIAARLGPESIWNITTYGGQSCKGASIQTFQGSGSSSCEAISGKAGSVYARTSFGTYDFDFHANKKCKVKGTSPPEYQVNGEKCIALGDLDPESFEVDFVGGTVSS